MKSQLREIYELLRCGLGTPSAEYSALERKTLALWDEVSPVLGKEAVDELLSSYSDLAWQSDYEWFREGFRLGVALMLESFPA